MWISVTVGLEICPMPKIISDFFRKNEDGPEEYVVSNLAKIRGNVQTVVRKEGIYENRKSVAANARECRSEADVSINQSKSINNTAQRD